MSGRRGGNRIRGPQSALTDFLAANNISAQQIRDDYERRRRESEQDAQAAGEGSSTAVQDDAEEVAAAVAAAEEAAEAAAENTRKRKRNEKEAIEKIKKGKAKKQKKGKKADSDDEDGDYDDGLGKEMYSKSRPAPGQFEHCEICNKRFTVTPYSKDGPDGGLVCTPCGKELAKDAKAEKKAVAKKPAGRKRRKIESDRLDGVLHNGSKTLQQLCIEKVAKHHDDIEEFGDMPQSILDRLGEIFAKKRVLNPRTLKLFLRPDLDGVAVHDAAYLEVEDYEQMFAVSPHVRKVVLRNACQLKDAGVEYMLEKCDNLEYIQLYAANLVTEEAWYKLFQRYNEKLKAVKLQWLDAAFEDEAVEEMVRSCPNLERVKFKLCRRLGQDTLAHLSQLKHLKHLSLQIKNPVESDALISVIQSVGHNLQTLSLEAFLDADDAVLQSIHDNCTNLSKLRFTENDTATDAGFTALFTDWKNPPLTFVDANSTRDVDNNNPHGPDDPIGLASNGFKALMAHSGSTLQHLDIASCRHISGSAFIDVFNGSTIYPALETLNLSFCNVVDQHIVAGIFKSCPALKKITAFGCFYVLDVVVPRGVALIGVPKAQDAIEQIGVGVDVEGALGLMREIAAF